jgi:hypothetical protein
VQGDLDGDGGTPAALKGPTHPPLEPSISPPDRTPPTPRGTEGPSPDASSPVWSERNTPGPLERMVVDRQKVKTSSESRRYSVAGRLEVRAGRMVRQAGTESRKEARVKTGRTSKRE